MRKLTGYIPIEGEITQQSLAEDKAVKIAGVWHKPAEVWVAGVTIGTDLWNKTHFMPKPGEEKHSGNQCANCGRYRSGHKGPDGECMAKGEKQLPGRKWD